MGYNIGPKIGIEGEKEFRDSIKKINQEYKTLQAETKAVTAAFEANGDEQGKLEATGKQLEKQIENQKAKVELLRDAVAKASAKYKDNSIEINRLRGALYDAQATVSGLEGELKDVRDQLNNADRAMEDFEDSTDGAGKAALDFKDILAGNFISDLAVDALRETVDLVKDFAVGSVEIAAEVKAANSQFSQSFGSLEESAREALGNISDDTNIASTRMQESYTRIFAFAKTVGAESGEALDIASRAMVAAADSAAYYDRSIENVTETLQSFLKGNYENDAALGISATEVSRNTKANELYAKSFQELSESQKVDVLLAMVEAGNAASGAIGQAARESDSWENVTGELSEAVRQLQAEAGKPALQKLTPVIQKITDATYELIEDVDWDEFGETVADVIDTVVDDGPKIVKTIASIGAGVAAFKAVKKAGDMVTLASSFLQIGTAAKTAGTAVAVSGTIAAASPWGLAALAIGGVVAAVTALSLRSEETFDSVEDMSDAVEDFKNSMESAESTCADTISEIEGTAYAAEHYLERLKDLEAGGLNTAAANEEYARTVEALNALMPELNLYIDEQTGLLNKNIDAIGAEVDAWKKKATAQALQDKYTDQLKAQGEAQAEVFIGKAKLLNLQQKEKVLSDAATAAQAKYQNACDRHIAIADKLNHNQELSAEQRKTLQQESKELAAAELDLYEQWQQCEDALGDNLEEQKLLNTEIEGAENTVASYDSTLQEATTAMNLYEQQISETTDKHQEMQIVVNNVQSSIDTLATAYDEALTSARESIDSQIGLFDELETESEWSASKIVENWEKQQKAFVDYSANLQKAMDMGLDEELVKQLSDGSQDSMQIIDELVNDSEISISKINASFGEVDQARDNLSVVMENINGDLDDELAEIVATAQQGGLDIVDGLIAGVDIRRDAFRETIRQLMLDGQDTTAETNDSHSPSRKYKAEAINMVDGLIVGADDMISKFEQKMEEVATAGQLAYLNGRLARAESYPDMYGDVMTSTVTNSSRTVNLGGINVQIYPQAGQNADEIADVVLSRLQIEIARKEAAL